MNLHVDKTDKRTIHDVSYFEVRGECVYVEYSDGTREVHEATAIHGGDVE